VRSSIVHHKVCPAAPGRAFNDAANVWDKWIELYGRNLDAFYPVADTAIGRLGFPDGERGLLPR